MDTPAIADEPPHGRPKGSPAPQCLAGGGEPATADRRARYLRRLRRLQPPAWSRWYAALLPACSFALVCGLDAVQSAAGWPVPVAGLLDEPAHLLTAGLFLAAALPRRFRRVGAWALLGSMLIDLDHMPLYMGWTAMSAHGGRPVTHSAMIVVLLLLVAAAVPRRRTILAGLAVGVVLHFVRDLATGPGVPLLWPWQMTGYRVAHGTYLATLAVVTVVATLRWRPRRHPRTVSASER